jgi:hydroxymethylbilane synthase
MASTPQSVTTSTLRIATRPSPQARTQAQFVADAMMRNNPGLSCQLVLIESSGDLRAEVPLHQMAGQGIFVKEVQRAVLDGRADVAVHSAKDLPTTPEQGLTIGAWCERRDPRDVLIGAKLNELANGATVATGSVRRRAQLRAVRPDLQFVELRGNIGTRLERIPDNGAIVMAAAALQVLGLSNRISEVLDPEMFVPMVGQGCVAIEHRFGDVSTQKYVASIDHEPTRQAVEIERAFLGVLGTGCALPVGAFVDKTHTLTTFLASGDDKDSTSIMMQSDVSDHANAKLIAMQLARTSRDQLARR